MAIVTDSTFAPAWWLANPQLQTLWPALLRRPPGVVTRRVQLPTADGDMLDLDWYGPEHGAIVILLHGLSGSSKSTYILGMQAKLARCGWLSVAMNFRGCGGAPNRTARSYHSGDTEDLDHLYRQLRHRYPTRAIAAVGYSLGGNVLLKWLGEIGRHSGLSAAAAVSVPLLLNDCADRMDQGFSKLYRDRLIKELKHYVQQKQTHLRRIGADGEADKLARLGDLSPIRSFWEYDDRVVARLYGFADAHDYYRQSSSRQYLKSIATPTLVIQAIDDPFMTPAVLPSDDELSPALHLEVTASGGHLGFVAGAIPGRPHYWLERRIPEFLRCQFTAQAT